MIVRVNVVLNRTVVVDSDWRFDWHCEAIVDGGRLLNGGGGVYTKGRLIHSQRCQ